MGPEVQVPTRSSLAPAANDTATRNVGDFFGGVEQRSHGQVPDAPGTPGPPSNTKDVAGLDQPVGTAQTPLVYTDSIVEETACRDHAGQLPPTAHTLPGGWQTGRHTARPRGMPVPPPRIPHRSAMHGTGGFRRHHGNRPRGPPPGHASPIPPEPAGPDHVDRRYGIMEPAQCCQVS